MPPLDVSIEVAAQLPDGLVAELAGFETWPLIGCFALRGRVADAAGLWGVLHRLHRSGLPLRSVVSVPARDVAAAPPAGKRPRRVRIELAGHAAALIEMALDCDELHLTPPAATTIVLRVADDEELFRVLCQLEDLALDVRRIEVT